MAEALASGAGGCGLPLEPVLDVFPPVGQVIFANWLATTSAMSGKSPIHSSRRLVPGNRQTACCPAS